MGFLRFVKQFFATQVQDIERSLFPKLETLEIKLDEPASIELRGLYLYLRKLNSF